MLYLVLFRKMQLHQQSVGPVNRVEPQATHTTAPQNTMMYPAGTQVYGAQTGQQPTVRYEKYAAKSANGLAITQIAVGVMCIIFQIASLALHAEFAEIGSGIWCGILVSLLFYSIILPQTCCLLEARNSKDFIGVDFLSPDTWGY